MQILIAMIDLFNEFNYVFYQKEYFAVLFAPRCCSSFDVT